MSDLFQNRYKTNSLRLPRRDYRNAWWYFVTICTDERMQHFGEVIDWKVMLSEIGEICKRELVQTEILRENVTIDECVIMPDHVHAIIVIDTVEARRGVSKNMKKETSHRMPLHNVTNENIRDFWNPVAGSLSSMINLFKWSVTRNCNRMFPDRGFKRQKWYYEHIIRNELALNNIRNYIIENPLKRELEKNDGVA